MDETEVVWKWLWRMLVKTSNGFLLILLNRNCMSIIKYFLCRICASSFSWKSKLFCSTNLKSFLHFVERTLKSLRVINISSVYVHESSPQTGRLVQSSTKGWFHNRTSSCGFCSAASSVFKPFNYRSMLCSHVAPKSTITVCSEGIW